MCVYKQHFTAFFGVLPDFGRGAAARKDIASAFKFHATLNKKTSVLLNQL